MWLYVTAKAHEVSHHQRSCYPVDMVLPLGWVCGNGLHCTPPHMVLENHVRREPVTLVLHLIRLFFTMAPATEANTSTVAITASVLAQRGRRTLRHQGPWF